MKMVIGAAAIMAMMFAFTGPLAAAPAGAVAAKQDPATSATDFSSRSRRHGRHHHRGHRHHHRGYYGHRHYYRPYYYGRPHYYRPYYYAPYYAPRPYIGFGFGPYWGW